MSNVKSFSWNAGGIQATFKGQEVRKLLLDESQRIARASEGNVAHYMRGKAPSTNFAAKTVVADRTALGIVYPTNKASFNVARAHKDVYEI